MRNGSTVIGLLTLYILPQLISYSSLFEGIFHNSDVQFATVNALRAKVSKNGNFLIPPQGVDILPLARISGASGSRSRSLVASPPRAATNRTGAPHSTARKAAQERWRQPDSGGPACRGEGELPLDRGTGRNHRKVKTRWSGSLLPTVL